MASRAIDTVITFRVLKLLTKKWTDHEAYDLGIIDKKGKRNKEVEIDTKQKKDAYTFLHRLVFNLKRIIQKVPFGKSKFASYAVALALLKEHCELSDEQGEELYEKFYRWLKDNDKFDPEQLTEAVGFQNDLSTGTYNLRHRIDECKPRTAVDVKECITKVYGINVYEGYVGDTRILLSAEAVY